MNAHHYDDPNARIRLNRLGQPVAIQRKLPLGQPGSFAVRRYRAICASRIVSLSPSSVRAWVEHRSMPWN